MSNTKWNIQGEYFESCNCEVLCPCLLSGATARPTEGHCDVVLAYRIDKGSFGGTDLSGLKAVQAITTPGPMAQGNGTLAVYVDSHASPEQRNALTAIFSGNAGGPPALLGGMIANRLPSKVADIDFKMSGNERTVSIPGITDVKVKGVAGRGTDVVWMENVTHPLTSRLAVAKGENATYQDHSMSFTNTGRNGHFSGIDWSV